VRAAYALALRNETKQDLVDREKRPAIGIRRRDQQRSGDEIAGASVASAGTLSPRCSCSSLRLRHGRLRWRGRARLADRDPRLARRLAAATDAGPLNGSRGRCGWFGCRLPGCSPGTPPRSPSTCGSRRRTRTAPCWGPSGSRWPRRWADLAGCAVGALGGEDARTQL